MERKGKERERKDNKVKFFGYMEIELKVDKIE